MIGAIIGDMVGSIYEFNNIKTKNFKFFDRGMEPTDDSVLTIATAKWLMNGGDISEYYYRYARMYPNPSGDYGPGFLNWLDHVEEGVVQPYNSCGNGSAMRVAPVGWAFETEEETLKVAEITAACTHNHPAGIAGAQATALCIFMARHGATKEQIKERVTKDFGYDLTMTVDEIRPRYSWAGLDGMVNGCTCQGSVPQAIICALDAEDYEDAIRNSVSIGGDSDTIACIAGGIAEALYGVPEWMLEHVNAAMDDEFRQVIADFEKLYGNNILKENK